MKRSDKVTDPVLAVQGFKHQLRNIEQVLLSMTEVWRKEADALDAEPLQKKLAQAGEWEKLASNITRAAEKRARADELSLYIDTWAEP